MAFAWTSIGQVLILYILFALPAWWSVSCAKTSEISNKLNILNMKPVQLGMKYQMISSCWYIGDNLEDWYHDIFAVPSLRLQDTSKRAENIYFFKFQGILQNLHIIFHGLYESSWHHITDCVKCILTRKYLCSLSRDPNGAIIHKYILSWVMGNRYLQSTSLESGIMWKSER